MKRIIACLILLALCLAAFASCGEDPVVEEKSNLSAAREYLFTMYKNSAAKTLLDFKRVSVITISGEEFTVEWTAEVKSGPADGVKVVANGDKTVTIDINETPEEEMNYTLTATLKKGDETESVSFDHFVPGAKKSEGGLEVVEEVKTGVAYKFALEQVNRGETLFFAGYMSGNYLATTEDFTAAVDVYAEEVEGGYRLYFLDGETKKYVEIYEYAAGKAGVQITTEPTTVFTWNADAKTFFAHVADDDRYLGTYSTYNTISASSISYITGDNASKVGISQFPAHLCTVKVAMNVADEVKTGVAYKFALEQVNRGETLFFSGAMSGNYFATTQNFMEAVDVYAEEVEGGYRLYFLDGETKNYMEIYEYAAGKAGVHITTEPTTVFTWNADAKTFFAHVADDDRYLGTYSTYNTISASSISYITGDNASKVGISQFPAHLCTVAVPTKVAETPKTGVAYKFSLEQVNRGETLFFTGKMSGNYLATSQSVSEAVNVFVEEVEGGYRFYFLDGETKNYVEIYEYTAGKAGVQITTEPTTVFTWNDEAKTFFAHVADDDRYLGTYSTYNTISASSISYITGDNASKVGISQFPAHLVIIGF